MRAKMALASAAIALLLCPFSLSGCSGFSFASRDASAPVGRASLPVFEGWYSGHRVFYVITDISDLAMARSMGSNLSTRLSEGVPEHPGQSRPRTALERVYVAEDAAQAKVFASAPNPIGPGSKDEDYSPLWLVVKFEWIDPGGKTILRSEADILKSAADGRLRLSKTDIVINCPILAFDDDRTLAGVMIHRN